MSAAGRSLDEILGDFESKQSSSGQSVKAGGPVCIWMAPDLKSRYDRLQEVSGGKFSKKLREIMAAAIEVAESKVGIV